ncbi:MAG TPA: cobaltochelatase subunit CobN [Methylocella sp.]|nr:cobaltochelatase subunit CobN [Methylocella sp.]
MHLLRTESRSLDEAEPAVDLGQSPADVLFLSFSDSDLSLIAAAARRRQGLSLRLANLSDLKHPYSVDLYIEKAASEVRFVLVRLLGGLDYWRYGVEEFSRLAREKNFALAIVPGDGMEDARLSAASTLSSGELQRIHSAFQSGAVTQITALLDTIDARLRPASGPAAVMAAPPIPAAGRFEEGCRKPDDSAGHAMIVFYRSMMVAEDTLPVLALADALASRRIEVAAVFAASLKDRESIAFLRAELARAKPDVILNATGFSARLDSEASVLEAADTPILQVIFAGLAEAQWRESSRGLRAADLAMYVVLPEMDGRLITRAVACKALAEHQRDLEFTPRIYRPLPSRVSFVADLAASWVRLRGTEPQNRKIACVLSDYPGKKGQAGYAVGLDTAGSVSAIAKAMSNAGYIIGALPETRELMRHLESAASTARLPLADYAAALNAMPSAFVEAVQARWGAPKREAHDGAFAFPILRAGNFLISLQPDRGGAGRKTSYHDTALPPCHSYIAFYVWLRQFENIHAMIHCGTHGTLEWLPGKAVALDENCAPEAVLGPVPVIYPFIVNNPGEAAQAKRRICALTIGHLTPPLRGAGSHGAALELEALFDEYAIAESLDPNRAKVLAKTILDRARETRSLQDAGVKEAADPATSLRLLDAWLCDLKEMRIADGLHVFGQSPLPEMREATVEALLGTRQPDHGFEDHLHELIDRSGGAEIRSLLKALDGRFVPPGPGGAPLRGRIDVLPTGRNLYGIDPRGIPTRAAYEIGQHAAQEIIGRYTEEHGDWPRQVIVDVWASAAMRTGGDDLAQAFALMGIRPLWDHATSRVTGFEIFPAARLGRPRVDVSLRISGLFRDVFPAQIALFDQAVQALAESDEEDELNPLAAAYRAKPERPLRVFGGAPGAYGIGLCQTIGQSPKESRADLGGHYLASASHAYRGAGADSIETAEFANRVANADALIHMHDLDGQDVLDADAVLDHEAGFAAAAQALGNESTIYHVDTAKPGAIKVRSLQEEIARAVRGRATNPRWIFGQMRHGHRGAAEIAATASRLYALALLTDCVASHHFDLLFEATLATPEVRDFLIEENPSAARAMAQNFRHALDRGFWQERRNSTLASLASFEEALP